MICALQLHLENKAHTLLSIVILNNYLQNELKFISTFQLKIFSCPALVVLVLLAVGRDDLCMGLHRFSGLQPIASRAF